MTEEHPPFRMTVYSTEGTSSPFMARLLTSVQEGRDQVVSNDPEDRQLFDSLYDPVFEAMRAMRVSARQLRELLQAHEGKVASKEIIEVQRNAVSVTEDVDEDLRRLHKETLSHGATAYKGIQRLTKELGLDIGFLYQTSGKFEAGCATLTTPGAKEFVSYLRTVRSTWAEEFVTLRGDSEHAAAVPDRTDYRGRGADLQVIYPMIAGERIDTYAIRTTNRVIGFVESVLWHAIALALHPGLQVVEIPDAERDPSYCRRFKIWGLRPALWVPTYQETSDFTI